MTRQHLLLGLSLLAVGVGCGNEQGDKIATERPEVVQLSQKELADAAERICRRVTVRLAQIAQSTKGIPGSPEQVLAVTRTGFIDLKRLRPPARLAERFGAFLREVEKREEQRKDILGSLPKATPGLGLAVTRFNYFTARANAAARHLRLTQCPGF